MSDDELARLEALAGAATPGPWYRTGYAIRFGDGDRDVIASLEGPSPEYLRDSNFIAAARCAVPQLVAEVRRLNLWLSRFANDSDAYRQGVEDGKRQATENEYRTCELCDGAKTLCSKDNELELCYACRGTGRVKQ